MLKKKNKSVEKTEKKSVAVASDKLNFVEIFGVENHGGWVFNFILAVIILAVVLTAIGVMEQIQSYRYNSKQLKALQENLHQLQVENQRMLIEQQAFSSTPQIVERSAALGMSNPAFNERMIIEVNPSSVQYKSAVASQPSSKLGSGINP